MRMQTLIAAAIAAAFAVSCAHTARDRTASRTTGTPAASADGGAEAMFIALDKNKDGFISREEAKGTPHEADFDMLDKDGDGKLSRAEHAAAPQHAGAMSATENRAALSAGGKGGDAGVTRY